MVYDDDTGSPVYRHIDSSNQPFARAPLVGESIRRVVLDVLSEYPDWWDSPRRVHAHIHLTTEDISVDEVMSVMAEVREQQDQDSLGDEMGW